MKILSRRFVSQLFSAAAPCLLMVSCVSPNAATEPTVAENIDSMFEAVVDRHRVATLGAGIIRNGQLSWAGYYGEQAAGIPASRETLFNVGSVAKTVTAELALRLAAIGEISLDEPMSDFWIDPDLIDDPRHRLLTPRIVLTHKTGFPNWRYTDPEFKLRFNSDPGMEFGYSGEGMDYLARFLERKLGQSFDALVHDYIIAPLDLSNFTVTRHASFEQRLAMPVDEQGTRHSPYCSSAAAEYCMKAGEWSAADELATSVNDYAAFMLAVMEGQGVSPAIQRDRLTVHSSTAMHAVLGCDGSLRSDCPVQQGYGLGWEIFEYAGHKIVSHGGSDWSERALVYFDVQSRDGIVLFINAPASSQVNALLDALLLLDPDSPMIALYRGWIDAYERQNTTISAD